MSRLLLLLLLLFNTWVSRGWPFWPIVDAVSRALPVVRPLFGLSVPRADDSIC